MTDIKRIGFNLEYCGFHYNSPTEQDGEYYIEFGMGTPEGEDWYECIWYDGSFDRFVDSLQKRVDDFDIDEEVEIWIPSRGKNGVPSSITALIEDAKWKLVQLEHLLEVLQQ